MVDRGTEPVRVIAHGQRPEIWAIARGEFRRGTKAAGAGSEGRSDRGDVPCRKRCAPGGRVDQHGRTGRSSRGCNRMRGELEGSSSEGHQAEGSLTVQNGRP